jgi:L-alanine-DL-glutamate epimerase-like enolase superfamily enzyme
LHHAVFHGGAHASHGMVHLTEAPGFGLEIDWKAVEKFRS